MPQVIPAVASAISGAIVAIGGGTFAAATVGLAAATAFEYGATLFLLNKASSILNKRGKTGESRGLEVSIADSNAEARIIYGEVRVGGVHMIPGVTSGTNGEHLHTVLALAVHEIDSFQAHYIDQDTIPTPASITGAAGDGLVSTGTYANKLWIRGYTGTMTQTVDYILNAAFPSQWASTARARGFAYVAYKFAYSKGEIYKSIPVPTVKVRGAKVYDPRLDSTNGGSGSQRYTDPTTWTYSNNPALCWANYRMMDYGYDNDPATQIDWTTVAAAADVCDALVANKDGGTSARYTCNGTLINEPENLLDNEQKLIDAMLGHRTCVGGKYQIYAGAWETPGAGYTIAKEDWLTIDSIVTVSPQDRSGRFSEVHCFFVDPNRNWQRVEAYVRRNATYLADDAGYPAAIEMEQPLCTDESEAQRKAEFVLRQSRNGVKLVGTLPPRFQFLKTFKTVALNFAELGWTSKTFRIVAYDANMDGSVKVALSEEQDTDWTDLASGDYGTPSTAAVPTVNPTSPNAVTSLTVTGFPGAIDIAWPDSTIKPVGTRYRVMEASVNSYQQALMRWEGDMTRAVLAKTNTATFYYWVDAVSAQGSYSTFPGVSSGVAGAAKLVDTDNIAPNAVSWVFQVNCLVTQTHSTNGPFGFGVAELNIAPSSITTDGYLDIYARSDFGNANDFPTGNQYLQMLGKCGVNSYYYIGSGTIIPRSFQTDDALASFNAYGTFPVIANNSAALYLQWILPNSGTHSFMHREDILRAEFRKR